MTGTGGGCGRRPGELEQGHHSAWAHAVSWERPHGGAPASAPPNPRQGPSGPPRRPHAPKAATVGQRGGAAAAEGATAPGVAKAVSAPQRHGAKAAGLPQQQFFAPTKSQVCSCCCGDRGTRSSKSREDDAQNGPHPTVQPAGKEDATLLKLGPSDVLSTMPAWYRSQSNLSVRGLSWTPSQAQGAPATLGMHIYVEYQHRIMFKITGKCFAP